MFCAGDGEFFPARFKILVQSSVSIRVMEFQGFLPDSFSDSMVTWMIRKQVARLMPALPH